MATNKITEKPQVEVKDDAKFLITQKEVDETDGEEKESVRRATISEVVKVLREKGINKGLKTIEDFDEDFEGVVKNVEPIETGIRITFGDDTSLDIAIESGGLAFDEVSYNQETGYLHILLEGEDVVSPCYIGGSGGGSSSGTVPKVENLTGASSLTIAHGNEVTLLFSYYDYDSSGELTNSSGNLELSVNGRVVLSQNIEQGEISREIGSYLSEGTNKIKVKVTDEDDNYATKTWTINAVALSISATFDETAINTGDISFKYTPVGNNIDKTIHFEVDGEEVATAVVTASNRQQKETIPAQPHGAHLLKVYATATVDGVPVTSNVLVYDVIWVEEGNNTPIIACSYTGSTMQYSTVSIPYIVYSPASLTTDITLTDGKATSSLNVDRTPQTWAYKATESGDKTLIISCGEKGTDTYAEKKISLTVTDIGVAVEPVTTGLVLDLNPAGRTNNDTDRALFGYTDENGVNHPLTFSDNFDWTNGGFKTDSDGNTYFCVKCGTYVQLDRSLFDDDAMKSGKEFKVVFKATNCRNYDAQVASCMSDGIGFILQAQKAKVSSEQTSIEVPYCEDSIIEMDVNIEADSKDRAMMVWLKGVPARVDIYEANDNFTQNTPEVLTFGSNDCDVHIYRVKAYDTDLTRLEIHENWIADASSGEEMLARYNRNNIYDQNGDIDVQKLINASPNLRVITVEADKMTTGKEDEVTCKVTHVMKSGGNLHTFTGESVIMKAQGTSSAQYGAAALNLDLKFEEGFVFGDGSTDDVYAMTSNSIGVNYFNIKLNVASSENANNVVLADEYNTYQPYLNPARVANPMVRDTVEGHPCVVFYKNTSDKTVQAGSITVPAGATILYGCGDMNNSKKNFEVFGQFGNAEQCCVELLNNTDNINLWKSDDLSSELWDGEGAVEFRYPKNPTDRMKSAFQRVLSWVVSTDREQATELELANPVTYGETTYTHDTIAYRAAKFVNELENYFIKDSVLYHYLFTERHAMVDNRAKNVFVSTDDGIHWDFTKDYDNDTADGNDNEGGLTLSYGLEDIDTIGTKDVFNASDSVIWKNVRDLMYDELCQMFTRLESAGAWDAKRILDKFTAHQAARPEALVIEDMWKKYIRPYTNSGEDAYLDMMYGTKADQRRQFEMYQEKYISSKYMGTVATSDTITFRAYTPENWGGVAPNSNITVTTYADMYIVIKSGSGVVKQRAKRGVPYTLVCPIDTLNDTEIYIYGASNVADVGDLAPLYVGYFNIAAAVKLRHLKLGDGTVGYVNTNATSITLGNNVLLETLDIQNCPNIRQGLDLTTCQALTTLEARCDNYVVQDDEETPGITGVSFAPGGNIVTAHIPAVSSLSARMLKKLTDFTIASYLELRSVWIEECPTLNALEIVKLATGLARARILGIDWIFTDSGEGTTIMDRLAAMKGIDESNHNIDTSVVTGEVYIPIMRESRLSAYSNAWPGLEVSYETLIQQYLVTFKNWDGTVLHTEYVDRGENIADPIETGAIKTPTREMSESTVYTFDGWDDDLQTVISARMVNATYSESPREYTVRWFSQSGVVVDSQTVGYGSEAVFAGDIPTRTDEEAQYVYYLFKGWDKSTGFIKGDTDVYALWERGELPPEGTDISAMNPAQIYAVTKNGAAQSYFELKDRVNVQFGYMPTYSNIQHEDVADEMVLDGATYLDTGIQLLKGGIEEAWTLAVDCTFDDTTTDRTMVCCMQDDGYMGFKVKYMSGPMVQWGTNKYQTGATNYREMLVLRHEAGSKNLKVYSSQAYEDSIGFTELTKTIDTVCDATLVVGAAKSDAGSIGEYAIGTLHACRIWYGDLGETDCRKIANWPRETYIFEVGGFGNYRLSNDTVKPTSVDFICASLLERMKQMNTANTNEGGFSATSLFNWLQSRLYDAFPENWRKVMKQCVVKHNKYDANGKYEIVDCDANVWIPSASEMKSMSTEPWIYEGDWVAFFTDDNTRIKFLKGYALPEGHTIYISSTDPTLDTTKEVKEGDLWRRTTNYKDIAYIYIDGKWVNSSNYWLRGASNANRSNFGFVRTSGYPFENSSTAEGMGWSSALFGVCPRFSI